MRGRRGRGSARVHASLRRRPATQLRRFRMFYESDVRDVLGDDPRADARPQPRRRDGGRRAPRSRRLIPGARHQAMPGTASTVVLGARRCVPRGDRAVRRASCATSEAELESVARDRAVHRSRRLDGAGWAELGDRSVAATCFEASITAAVRSRARPVRRSRARYGRGRLLRHVRRPGALRSAARGAIVESVRASRPGVCEPVFHTGEGRAPGREGGRDRRVSFGARVAAQAGPGGGARLGGP